MHVVYNITTNEQSGGVCWGLLRLAFLLHALEIYEAFDYVLFDKFDLGLE